MLPNIPCVRHPLLLADSLSTDPGVLGVAPAFSGCPPASPPESEKTENRSDSGQFRSDSIQNSHPSTPRSQPLWSLQPDEPALAYQLFAAWLQLPAPRHLRKAAATLGCSLHRLRQLSARNHWKTRAAAFDQHRANAANLSLDQLVRDETLNWKERAQRFRDQEWLLHEEMLEAARLAVHQFQRHPGRASLSEIVALYELASLFGHRACGKPFDPAGAGGAARKPGLNH
jgi:hypothetical protein